MEKSNSIKRIKDSTIVFINFLSYLLLMLFMNYMVAFFYLKSHVDEFNYFSTGADMCQEKIENIINADIYPSPFFIGTYVKITMENGTEYNCDINEIAWYKGEN